MNEEKNEEMEQLYLNLLRKDPEEIVIGEARGECAAKLIAVMQNAKFTLPTHYYLQLNDENERQD